MGREAASGQPARKRRTRQGWRHLSSDRRCSSSGRLAQHGGLGERGALREHGDMRGAPQEKRKDHDGEEGGGGSRG